MDAIYVGIDVSKDRLDVAVRPNGESFVVSRTGAGIDELIERLKPLSIKLVAIEAADTPKVVQVLFPVTPTRNSFNKLAVKM